MIEITPTFRSKYAGVVRKARTERIRVVRLENDLYYVARRGAGHGRYNVEFITAADCRVFARCKMVGTGWACKGTWQGRCCTHIAAAVERGVKIGRGKQKRAA